MMNPSGIKMSPQHFLLDWLRFEYEGDVPEEAHLRLQLTILEPGTYRIDDIRVERIDGDSV